jgi:hypothetical protein
VVPATLRLAVMPGFLGAQGNVFSAADLPSPGASPRRRGRTGPDDDDDGGAADAAAGRYSGGAAEEEEEEEAAAEYYEDDFEDDEDEAGHDETDDSDLDAAEDEAEAAHDGAGTSLQATLRTRAPGGGGGGGEHDSHLDALEAELRQLQLQNDEQAVVQDEVHALSGTLRAVAASLSATSGF